MCEQCDKKEGREWAREDLKKLHTQFMKKLAIIWQIAKIQIIFYHVSWTSFASTIRPIEMYRLKFSGSYAP
jgi:hypothetical protein